MLFLVVFHLHFRKCSFINSSPNLIPITFKNVPLPMTEKDLQFAKSNFCLYLSYAD